MAVFNDVPLGEKGLKEVYAWLDGFVEENQNSAFQAI